MQAAHRTGRTGRQGRDWTRNSTHGSPPSDSHGDTSTSPVGADHTKRSSGASESQTPRLTPGVFSSRSDEWFTPPALAQALADRYAGGAFALDAAACAASKKAPRFYTEGEDALTRDWHADAGGGSVWLNPPYSKVGPFLERAARTAQSGTTVVCLVPARTDTAWFHDHVLPHATEVLLVRGRITFTRPDGTGAPAPFPSMVVVYAAKRQGFPVFGAMLRDGPRSPSEASQVEVAA